MKSTMCTTNLNQYQTVSLCSDFQKLWKDEQVTFYMYFYEKKYMHVYTAPLCYWQYYSGQSAKALVF